MRDFYGRMVTVRCLTYVTKLDYKLKEHSHIYRGIGYEEAPLFINHSINHPWAIYSVQRSRIERTVNPGFESSMAEPCLGYASIEIARIYRLPASPFASESMCRAT